MEPRVLRLTEAESLADEWHLCLLADGIPHVIEPIDGKLALVVDEHERARADRILDEYDKERRQRALEREAPRAPDAPSRLGVVAAIGLVAFHVVTLPHRDRWLAAGGGAAREILNGEPWRAITALTLHADSVHVGGNAVAALIFFTALGRWLGGGVAALLIVLSGALGNLVNARAHAAGFSSIGASTAVFAGLGLLVALQLRRRRQATRKERSWLPIAGGLGLFAMLGTAGKQTDVLAHLCGLVVGGLVGALAAQVLRGRPRAVAQWGAGVLAIATLVGAWLLALHFHSVGVAGEPMAARG